MMYNISGRINPFNWNEWSWDQPTVPEQPDATSCGVFVMTFMQQWDGVNEMEAFKAWKGTKKVQRLKMVTDMRIQICLSILKSPSNRIMKEIETEADEYYLKKLAEMMKRKMQEESKKKLGKQTKRKEPKKTREPKTKVPTFGKKK